MPRGDKGAYTDKQKRKVEHIEESYEERGVCPISFSLSTVEYAQGATNLSLSDLKGRKKSSKK